VSPRYFQRAETEHLKLGACLHDDVKGAGDGLVCQSQIFTEPMVMAVITSSAVIKRLVKINVINNRCRLLFSFTGGV
jgi:hypothetical protein